MEDVKSGALHHQNAKEMVDGDASENVSDQSLVVLNKLVVCICHILVAPALLSEINVLYANTAVP